MEMNDILKLNIGDIVICTKGINGMYMRINAGDRLAIDEWRFDTISINEELSGSIILRKLATDDKFAIDIRDFHKYFTLYRKHDGRRRYCFPGYVYDYKVSDEQIKAYEEQFLAKWQSKMYHLPKLDHVLVNGDVTTAIWKDGTHTIVKRCKDDADDPEKAFMFLVLKRMFYNYNSELGRYLQEFYQKSVFKQVKDKESKESEAKDEN